MLRCVCPQSVCAGPRFTRLLQVTALSSDTCTSLMVRAGALQQWAWAKDLPGPSAKEQRELLLPYGMETSSRVSISQCLISFLRPMNISQGAVHMGLCSQPVWIFYKN